MLKLVRRIWVAEPWRASMDRRWNVMDEIRSSLRIVSALQPPRLSALPSRLIGDEDYEILVSVTSLYGVYLEMPTYRLF